MHISRYTNQSTRNAVISQQHAENKPPFNRPKTLNTHTAQTVRRKTMTSFARACRHAAANHSPTLNSPSSGLTGVKEVCSDSKRTGVYRGATQDKNDSRQSMTDNCTLYGNAM